MARQKDEAQAKRDQEQHEIEVAKLKDRIAELEAKQTSFDDVFKGTAISNEIRKIRSVSGGQSGVPVITVQETSDTTFVYLWTPWGKRLGPMHPANAEATLERFWVVLHVPLSMEKPSLEKQLAFQKTDVYKKMEAGWHKKEQWRIRSKKGNQFEKLAAEIAKLSGKPVKEIHNVFDAPKPLSEGRTS